MDPADHGDRRRRLPHRPVPDLRVRSLARMEKVGAPNAELRNSPIIDAAELLEPLAPAFETEEGVCYFNGQSYRVGTYVQSGSEVLQCVAGGVWVRRGETPP